MLNLLFALFLFGMLVVLCSRALSRALNNQQPLNSKELAMLVALSIGCMAALHAGVAAVYRTQLISF